MKFINPLLSLLLLFAVGLFLSGCSDDDDPDPGAGEEDEETITQVLLTFTPEDDEFDVVTATWLDADGDGTGAPTVTDIDLVEGEEYTLSISLANTLESPVEDITAEIREEDDEHQFFFAFTNNIFGNPMGDGNVDNRDDAVNYLDQDDNGNPVGLSTSWTAGGHTDAPGEFRVILKHQPDIKSATTTADDGGTDIDITFPLNIVEDPNEEEETITEVTLTFTPDGGGTPITAVWFDADGDGAGMPTIDDIELDATTSYEMSITLRNTLETPAEDKTQEIADEDDEHMFFFGFTADIFSSPTGDGNLGLSNRNDPMNYNDEDSDSQDGYGNTVGISTNWTTGTATSGTFNVVLKHQPNIKSATSNSTMGGTDIDIEFDIIIN